MKKRMKNAELKDYIKACRKAGREEEIAAHGRPVAVFRIHKSKKAYDRKRMKAADKKSLPFFVPKPVIRIYRYPLKYGHSVYGV